MNTETANCAGSGTLRGAWRACRAGLSNNTLQVSLSDSQLLLKTLRSRLELLELPLVSRVQHQLLRA